MKVKTVPDIHTASYPLPAGMDMKGLNINTLEGYHVVAANYGAPLCGVSRQWPAGSYLGVGRE